MLEAFTSGLLRLSWPLEHHFDAFEDESSKWIETWQKVLFRQES